MIERDPIENLVSRAQQGDRKAFDALFTRYHVLVRTYCARMLNSVAEGEQAAQDVFVQAWTHLASFRFDSPFENWLLRIATHTCFNLNRTKKNQDAARGVSLDHPETLAGVEARLPETGMEEDVVKRVFADQLLHRVRQRAKAFKPPWDTLDWHIFHLLYERGIGTAREVAQRVQRSEDTVKYRIYRRIHVVIKAVRDELENEEATVQHIPAHSVSE